MYPHQVSWDDALLWCAVFVILLKRFKRYYLIGNSAGDT